MNCECLAHSAERDDIGTKVYCTILTCCVFQTQHLIDAYSKSSRCKVTEITLSRAPRYSMAAHSSWHGAKVSVAPGDSGENYLGQSRSECCLLQNVSCIYSARYLWICARIFRTRNPMCSLAASALHSDCTRRRQGIIIFCSETRPIQGSSSCGCLIHDP